MHVIIHEGVLCDGHGFFIASLIESDGSSRWIALAYHSVGVMLDVGSQKLLESLCGVNWLAICAMYEVDAQLFEPVRVRSISGCSSLFLRQTHSERNGVWNKLFWIIRGESGVKSNERP